MVQMQDAGKLRANHPLKENEVIVGYYLLTHRWVFSGGEQETFTARRLHGLAEQRSEPKYRAVLEGPEYCGGYLTNDLVGHRGPRARIL